MALLSKPKNAHVADNFSKNNSAGQELILTVTYINNKI